MELTTADLNDMSGKEIIDRLAAGSDEAREIILAIIAATETANVLDVLRNMVDIHMFGHDFVRAFHIYAERDIRRLATAVAHRDLALAEFNRAE